MIVKQDNREFIQITLGNGRQVYYVHTIDNRLSTGREGSYQWLKCEKCGRIVGTQFNGYSKHVKSCETK